MLLNEDTLEEIIASRDFNALIGELESDWLECKSQPYHLKDDKNRRELGKDISSFANLQGGYILIGVQTKRNDKYLGDEIEEIKPFAADLINTGQYHAVIKEWVYPEIEGVAIQWIPTKDDTNKGVGIIRIQPQAEALRPFLMKNVLDGKKQVEIMFGYAERRRDNSQPYSVRDLQTALRLGLNYEKNLNNRFDALESQLKRLAEHPSTSSNEENVYEIIDDRISSAISAANLDDKRTFALTAFSPRLNDLKTFGVSESSIKKHLENPPTLRYGGWALATHEQAKIIRGELIRVVDESYKIIDLYRDGTTIFAVVADGNFLAWSKDREPVVEKINPVALVEVVYNFVKFYELVLEDLKERPDRISVRFDLRNMHKDDRKNYLAPYGINTWEQRENGNPAPDDAGAKIINLETQDFDAGKVSFEILKEIYLWFGLEEDKIPYTKTEAGIRMVDPEHIKTL